MKPFLTLFSLLALAATSAMAKVDYTGYKVLKAQVQNKEQAEFLHKLESSNVFNFWNDIRLGGSADIMASPNTLKSLERFLSSHRIEYSTMVEDVEELANMASVNSRSKAVKDPKVGHNMDWTSYHQLDEIYEWFDYLEETYDYVSTDIIGQSYEGRDVRVAKVCQGGCGNKPAMYIDSGIHAREWIGPAVNMYMLNQLTDALSTDNQHFVDDLDWYFIASVNPDGYQFTWDEDRMWRKTRKENPGSVCIGTDANRNYDWHWGGIGSSDSPCSESYHGTEAWSEVEAANIRDFVLSVKENVVFSDSIHSYSQLILLPWGYTNELPDNYDEQMRVGNKANAALFDVHGETYTIGNTWDTIYPASGLTVDWAFGAAEVPYSYSMELRDKGLHGFILPEDQIIPTGEEVWAFHAVVANEMVDLYANK